MKKEIKIEKRIHQGYTEWEKAKNEGTEFTQLFGRYQYLYSSKKGCISLIQLKNYFKQGEDLWEIYTIEGNIFEDVERFSTKKEAEKTIYKYLKD